MEDCRSIRADARLIIALTNVSHFAEEAKISDWITVQYMGLNERSLECPAGLLITLHQGPVHRGRPDTAPLL